MNPRTTTQQSVAKDSVQRFFSWAKSVGIEIRQTHIVFGHEKLPTVAIVGCKKLVGLVKLEQPRSSIDIYRLLVDMNWEDAAFCFKKNPSLYQDPPEHHTQRTMQYEEEYVTMN